MRGTEGGAASMGHREPEAGKGGNKNTALTRTNTHQTNKPKTGVRLVVEVKRGFDAQVVLNQLRRATRLEARFGANMVALVGGAPRALDLKAFLTHFLDFRVRCRVWRVVRDLVGWFRVVLKVKGRCLSWRPRRRKGFFLSNCTNDKRQRARHGAHQKQQVGVVERRARHALAKAKARLHLVEGFLAALAELDAVVKVRGGW